MNLFRFTCLCVLFLGSIATVNANDFEAALSSETAQFTFRSDSSLIGWGGADLAIGLFYNDESDFILQGGLIQSRPASEENPLTFGVGVKAYLGRLDEISEEVLALGVGGEVRYTIPGTMPMAFYLNANIAPDITSFAGVEEVVDYALGFQIEVLPQTIAFVGLRHFEFKSKDDGDYEVDDDELHFGVRLTF